MSNEKQFGLTNVGTDGVKQIPVESKEPTLMVPLVEKKKRGRPSKKVPVQPIKEFRCSTCREVFSEQSIMKIGTNDERYAAFCPFCQRSLGFVDDVLQKKVKDLVDNNPTGK